MSIRFLNLNVFFNGLDVFVFHYDYEYGKSSKKCKIKVGPRRFIEIDMISNECTVDLLCNGHSTYIHNFTVQFERKDNALFFDAVGFLKSNNAVFQYCSSDTFQSEKRFPPRYDLVESGECGLYTHNHSWADCNYYRLELHFKEGAFALNHHILYCVSWAAVYFRANPFESEFRSEIITLLDKPHSILGADLEKFSSVKCISNLDWFRLEFGDFSISVENNRVYEKGNWQTLYKVTYKSKTANETVTVQSIDDLILLLSGTDIETAILKAQLLCD